MVAFEHAGRYRCGKLTLLGVFALRYVYILGTNDNINGFVRFESFIHALEFGADKTAFIVVYHYTRNDVAFAYKVRYESVCRFVVNLSGRPDLLYLSVAHYDNGIAHRKGLFLVVGDVYESYAKSLMHIHKFNLHILPHFKVKRAERLVKKQQFRLVDYRPCNCDALLLSARQAVDVAVAVILEVHHFQRVVYLFGNFRFRIFAHIIESPAFFIGIGRTVGYGFEF